MIIKVLYAIIFNNYKWTYNQRKLINKIAEHIIERIGSHLIYQVASLTSTISINGLYITSTPGLSIPSSAISQTTYAKKSVSDHYRE